MTPHAAQAKRSGLLLLSESVSSTESHLGLPILPAARWGKSARERVFAMPRLLQRRSGRISFTLILSLLANVGLAGAAAYLFLGAQKTPPALTGQVNRPASSGDTIEALGRVQPISGVISIFGPPGDQISEWKVQLGSTLNAGDPLGTLRGQEERNRSLKALDAQIREAEALKAAISKSRQAKENDLKLEAEQALKAGDFDLQAVAAKITGLGEQLRLAKSDQERLKKIEQEGVPVSPQERDQVQLMLTKAEQELAAAQSQKAKAEQAKSTAASTLNSKVATLEAETERGLAQVPLAALQASRKVAEQKLLDAELKAPIAGRVVKMNARVGETITNMPILQIADTSQMLVIAEVYETDIPRLRDWLAKSGKPVTVKLDARVLSGDSVELSGTTTAERITPMIARNAVFALGPREDADRRVVEVEVALDNKSSQTLSNFIGLQVRVRFQPPK
jgi:HlyD family secretion protein